MAQASTTAWIVATTPVFMALFGRLILKEGLVLINKKMSDEVKMARRWPDIWY